MSTRVHSIAELAQFAQDPSPANQKTVKDWLRIADALRKQGNTANSEGNLEAAFLYYARSGTIVMEKIPNHKAYHELNAAQKTNLNANGRDIIHSMEQLKPKISDTYEQWAAKNPELVNSPPRLQQLYGASISPVVKSRATKRSDNIHDHYTNTRSAMSSAGAVPVAGPSTGHVNPLQRSNSIGPGYSSATLAQDDLARRMQQLNLGPRAHSMGPQQALAIAPQQQALSGPSQDAELSRRVAEAVANKKWQQDVAEEVKRKEQDRVMYEQQKNESRRRAQESAVAAAKQAAAMSITYPNSMRPPSAQSRQAQARGSYPQEEQPFGGGSGSGGGALPHLPLQSPLLFQERDPPRISVHDDVVPPWRQVVLPPTAFVGGAEIEYPRLMSPHQQQQGYFPNPQPLMPIISGRPLPLPQPQPQIQPQIQSGGHSLYNIPLPQRASPHPPYNSSQHTTPTYGRPGLSYSNQQVPMSLTPRSAQQQQQQQQQYQQQQYQQQQQQQQPHPSAPRVLPAPPTASTPTQAQTVVPRPASPTHDGNGLRLIDVPSEVLNRFLSVAQMNTLRKKETCGLLLGREKAPGRGYILCTLLIPEQRSTADTCTMENEELVVEFQIGRELVTLGWIHTHPTQSCFMSSLDLHTHSGYQNMLKEAIAIVCAPSSQPQFGVFRLTDPSGLNTILTCTAKETFHPHSEPAIYTDSSHVRLIDDLPLEIVDLRRADFSASEGTARSM